MIKFLTVCGIFFFHLNGRCLCDLNVVYQWNKLNLSLQENDREHRYIPENNLVYRMKIWNDTLFMAIPRFKRGVPATLCRSYGGAIHPYPSLGLQKVGNCFGMQNVKDIEIDHLGHLWILDVGNVYDLEPVSNRSCDPKLFVVDLNTGYIVRSAVLPRGMYTNRSVLSGLTVDLKSLTAVVADIGPDPGFIVYNLQIGIFHKFPCELLATAKGYNEALLTVSPIDNMLYFTTIELNSLFAIPLSVFGVPFIKDVGHYVNNQGLKADTSTAMIMDTTGNLYLGMTRKVIAWNTLKHGFDVKELYIQEVRLDWISSFAFDSNGYLWIISSEFKDFRESKSKRTNMLIFKRYCGTTSFALHEVAAAGSVNHTGTTAVQRNSVNAKYTAENLIHIFTLVILHVIFARDIL
ncbi:Six-bladed beta-propeller, TolB-like,Major royal jelly protein/protein yellow [Cinara cedri]|uniref:Six-bladed beta-propeller, TolB-like,Major royal jelly protein/protein yellow n=1 Tax=Cinara cedri TaxID=506608 RepID=A0A5E4MFB1_9HEMI|nr:Six-bladed beta-propeller, TolB-like,Major royal jelly protein/protein yellow [Cinara cedri]